MAKNKDEIKSLLIDSGKKFSKFSYMADHLGISYQVLTYWMEVCLGLRKDDFYRKFICKKNCKLLRVEGDYRYIVEKKVEEKSRCKCRSGFFSLIVDMSGREVKDFCLENEYEIKEIVPEDEYEVTIK
jgi:hypothetical protein